MFGHASTQCFLISGSARAVRRRALIQCRSQSDNSSRRDLNERRPLDSIDVEWRVSKLPVSVLHFHVPKATSQPLIANVVQALNQEKARTYFSSRNEASMWDMIDISALPSTPHATQSPQSEISTHIDVQNRFWEHNPSSSVNYWDDFSRVCLAAHAMVCSSLIVAISAQRYDVSA